MLAYAAHQRRRRQLSPATLALIVGGHAAALAWLVTAKMDVTIFPVKPPIKVIDVPLPTPPDPLPPPPQPQPSPRDPIQSVIDRPAPVVPLPQPGPAIDLGPATDKGTPDIGPILERPIGPPAFDPPRPAPVRVGARAVTPSDLLRPPYPDSKRRSEEEAVLRLRLAIDERGRVTSVDPVGAADAAFLAAARTHLIRHWRYRPATEDGRPVATSLTITLRFELEDE